MEVEREEWCSEVGGVGGRVREMCGGWREGKKKVCREEEGKEARERLGGGGGKEGGGMEEGGRGRYGRERMGEVWRREEGGDMKEGGRGRYGGGRKGKKE